MPTPEEFARGGIIPGPIKATPTYIHPGAITSTRGCPHLEAVPVKGTANGETLAWLCPTCDAQLPASFSDEMARRREVLARRADCAHENTNEATDGTRRVIARWCSDCGKGLKA